MRISTSIAALFAAGLFLTNSGDAFAQCGMVTPEGECQGDVVVFCDVDTSSVVQIDCPAEYGAGTICQEIDPTYGVDCAVAQGEVCLFEDEGEFVSSFCQGNNAGCVETAQSITCEPNVGPCADGTMRICQGDDLLLECAVNQPYIVRCGTYGGTCSNGACVDIPAGSLCDDDTLVCAAGLVCGTLGLCEGMTAPDAGVVPDMGVSAPDAGVADTGGMTDDGGSCVCVKRNGAPWGALGMLGVFALLGFRRRD